MPVVLVISGPAGVGKTTICNRLIKDFGDQLSRVVTTTTRCPRIGEQNGKDYFFIHVEEFKLLLKEKSFLEHELIHGNYYGTSKKAVFDKISQSKNILINIDVKGAKSLREEFAKENGFQAKLVSVFLKPRNLNVLKQRLYHRGTEDLSDIKRRLLTAKRELSFADGFDHEIISSEKEHDYALVRKIFLQNL